MKRALHILTRPDDSLAQELISKQQTLPEIQIETADLTRPKPDYKVLLEQIFAADSVQVW